MSYEMHHPCAAAVPVDVSFFARIANGSIRILAMPASTILRSMGAGCSPIPASRIQPGAHLALSERWRLVNWHERHDVVLEYEDDTARDVTPHISEESYFTKWRQRIVAEANRICTDNNGNAFRPTEQSPLPWNPASTLPRWGCRLTVEVARVAEANLNSLSESDLALIGVHAQSRVGDDSMHPVWTMTRQGWRQNTPQDALRDYLRTIFAESWDKQDHDPQMLLLTVQPV